MTGKPSIAIIGAGLMGHGLALVFADGGHDVAITDPFPDTLATVQDRIAATLKTLGKDAAAVARVTAHATLAESVRDADIVIEAAPEKLPLKQEIFADLERHARPDALLASNTSVIPIGQIAVRVKSKHRVLGTHWWNPPYLVPLVEVIQTDGTAPETISTMMTLLNSLGKVPVHVKKDVPGFVGNRMQHALWREAIALIDEGVCDAETVDLVVKSSFGRRLAVLGPIENADQIGIDLTLSIQEYLLPHLNRATEPTRTLREMLANGKLGFKTNQGFKSWTEDEKTQLRARVLEHLTLLNKLLGPG